MVTRITISVMLLTLAGGAALADDHGFNDQDQHFQGQNFGNQGNQWNNFDDKDHKGNGCKHGCAAAPEIDPTQAVGALMLLGGAVAVLRGRRNKK
jgi:uncharacterized protein (TIGR03382 family)